MSENPGEMAIRIPYGASLDITVSVTKWWDWAIQLDVPEEVRGLTGGVPLNADDADALGDALKSAAKRVREVSGE